MGITPSLRNGISDAGHISLGSSDLTVATLGFEPPNFHKPSDSQQRRHFSHSPRSFYPKKRPHQCNHDILLHCFKESTLEYRVVFKGRHDLLSGVYLEVGIGYTLGDLFKKRLLDLFKLRGLNNVQDLLDLTQEHDLVRKHTHNHKHRPVDTQTHTHTDTHTYTRTRTHTHRDQWVQ